VPPKNITTKILKLVQNVCTIQRIKANNFGASWNIFAKLVHVMCRKAGMKIWVQIFLGLHPYTLRAH